MPGIHVRSLGKLDWVERGNEPVLTVPGAYWLCHKKHIYKFTFKWHKTLRNTEGFAYPKELTKVIRRIIKSQPRQGQQFGTRHLLVTYNHSAWMRQDKMFAMLKFQDRSDATAFPHAFVLTVKTLNTATAEDPRSSISNDAPGLSPQQNVKNSHFEDSRRSKVEELPRRSICNPDLRSNDQIEVFARVATSERSETLTRSSSQSPESGRRKSPAKRPTKRSRNSEKSDSSPTPKKKIKEKSSLKEKSLRNDSPAAGELSADLADLPYQYIIEKEIESSKTIPESSFNIKDVNYVGRSSFRSPKVVAMEPARSADITDLVMEGLMFTIRQDRDSVTVLEQKTKLEMDEVLENSEKAETKEGEKCLLNSSLLRLESLITKIEMSEARLKANEERNKAAMAARDKSSEIERGDDVTALNFKSTDFPLAKISLENTLNDSSYAEANAHYYEPQETEKHRENDENNAEMDIDNDFTALEPKSVEFPVTNINLNNVKNALKDIPRPEGNAPDFKPQATEKQPEIENKNVEKDKGEDFSALTVKSPDFSLANISPDNVGNTLKDSSCADANARDFQPEDTEKQRKDNNFDGEKVSSEIEDEEEEEEVGLELKYEDETELEDPKLSENDNPEVLKVDFNLEGEKSENSDPCSTPIKDCIETMKSKTPRVISDELMTDEQIPPELQRVLRQQRTRRLFNVDPERKSETEEEKPPELSRIEEETTEKLTAMEEEPELTSIETEKSETVHIEEKTKEVLRNEEKRTTEEKEPELTSIDKENSELMQIEEKTKEITIEEEKTGESCTVDVTEDFERELASGRATRGQTARRKNQRQTGCEEPEIRIEMWKFIQDITRGAKVVVRRLDLAKVPS